MTETNVSPTLHDTLTVTVTHPNHSQIDHKDPQKTNDISPSFTSHLGVSVSTP